MSGEGFATSAAKHYKCHPKSLAGLAPPVVFSSTFLVDDSEHSSRLAEKEDSATVDDDGFFYSRWASPTNQMVCQMVSNLEGAFGTYAFCSGMNAITTLLMTTLKSGDHVIAPRAVYGAHMNG